MMRIVGETMLDKLSSSVAI
jgi:hypothetical protein